MLLQGIILPRWPAPHLCAVADVLLRQVPRLQYNSCLTVVRRLRKIIIRIGINCGGTATENKRSYVLKVIMGVLNTEDGTRDTI